MDPFAPPGAPARAAPRPLLAPFVARRAVLHLVLPGLLATAQAVRGDGHPALTFAIASAVWVPSTIGLSWARYLAPRDDPRPVALVDGDVLSRRSYLQVQAWMLAEVGLLLVALVGIVVALAVALRGLVVAVPVALAFAAWSGWRGRDVWRLTRAVIAHADGDPAVALAAVAPLVGRGGRIADTARMLAAHAHLRRGDRAAATAALAAVRDPVGQHADLLLGQLALADGDLAPLRRALAAPRPTTTAAALWSREVARAHLDLAEGRADAILARATGAWRTAPWPAPWVAALDVLEAAAHHQRGDETAARAALARVPDLEERRWMAAIWPGFGFLG